MGDYKVSTRTPDGVARASKFAVSKVSTGGGGETPGRRNGTDTGHTFVKWTSVAAAKSSSSGSAVTTEPRRSIMRARAASMAPRAASPCTADGVAATLSMRLRPWAGIAQMSRARPLARLDCRSCSAAGWAETRTPLRHRRDTSQIPAAARAPPSRAVFRNTKETASPPRAHPPASARGQTIRALPWEDAAARFLQLGFEVARRPASCTRAFPYSPTVARFDPRQAGQTLNHGFPR